MCGFGESFNWETWNTLWMAAEQGSCNLYAVA